MRLARLVPAIALLAILPAAGGSATSFGRALPHDRARGCEALERVVADLNAGRLRARDSLLHPTFYSDEFGRVDEAEAPAFLHSLRHSEGKRDRKPIRIARVQLVHPDEVRPTYLVVLEREAWHETRLEQNDMLLWDRVPDPHYGSDWSHWLVTFQSNDVRHFREASELYPHVDERGPPVCRP